MRIIVRQRKGCHLRVIYRQGNGSNYIITIAIILRPCAVADSVGKRIKGNGVCRRDGIGSIELFEGHGKVDIVSFARPGVERTGDIRVAGSYCVCSRTTIAIALYSSRNIGIAIVQYAIVLDAGRQRQF